MMGSLDKEEQQMLEDALKELPPIKQRRIMKKVGDYVYSNFKLGQNFNLF